jgi:hypothetical protein
MSLVVVDVWSWLFEEKMKLPMLEVVKSQLAPPPPPAPVEPRLGLAEL